MSQNIENQENINNTDDMNIQKEELEKKEENIENEQNIINGKEQENIDNEKQNVEKEEDNKWNGLDINNMTIDKLREELKNRKIEIPKYAKKKDLQDLLIKSNK
jgi:hypothetical protein